MMNKRLIGVALLAGIALASLPFSGCTQPPRFEVTPATITFGAEHETRRLTLSNLGGGPAVWTLDTMTREDSDSPWEEGAIPWLEISKRSGTLAPGVEHISLTASREALYPGQYVHSAVRVREERDEKEHIVPISLVVNPLLHATPDIITLRPGELSAQFVLENRGSMPLTWSARFFDGNDASAPAVSLPPDLVLSPEGGTLARRGKVTVRANWTQARGDFGLRISAAEAPGHDAVVLFRFGQPFADLVVDPESLTLYYARPVGGQDTGAPQPESSLKLLNVGRQSISWTISVNTRGEAVDQSPATIAVEAASGALPPGQSETVMVRVNDPSIAIPGSGNYELVIEARDQEGVIIVPLILEAVALPVVIASYPPDPEVARPEYRLQRLLDFGRTSVQEEFWVVNIGPVESLLHYRIVHDGQGVESPLIVDVNPIEGHTNRPEGIFFLPGTNIMVNAQRVLVTVDRSAMLEDVEYRNLYIEAWSEDYSERLEAVARWQLEARVERPPMKIEGATNRSRPPYLMRFVFMMRDTLGRVIPTRTAEDRERIRFFISEDGVPLDLNETTYRVDGPEQLKMNMVVVLDYTGSMYYAGVDDPENPRAPGEVLDEIREATAMFLDDLPPGYRVALMYHNDRQPLNRLIHPFSTDRESLKSALRNFRVPPQLHGVSDIWDALVDAVNRIAAEDTEDTLPFDDADVRAVLFIGDGHDNASTVASGAAVSAAREHRVRLYPLAYSGGAPINFEDLIPLAEQTGGHFYNAGNPANLVHLLGYRRGLVLAPVPGPDAASEGKSEFKIRNVGRGPLSWNIVEDGAAPWLTEVAPMSGVIPPGGESLVSVTVNPLALTTPFGMGRATLHINSDNGSGSVVVALALNEAGDAIQDLSLSLRDEPGRVWEEFQNQIMLSYVTPLQRSARYTIRVHYSQEDGSEITGHFEEDGLYYFGDVRAGQIAMHTTGVALNYDAETWDDFARAEVFVRADYVPRNVNQFRMRFVPLLDENAPPELVDAFSKHEMAVELAPDGLLVFDDGARPNWRLVPENDGIYRMLTAREFTLPYGAAGNLLRLTFTNLWPFIEAADAAGIEPEFLLEMRVDNQVYYAPATQFRPSETVYFLYPSGIANPEWPLRIGEGSDLAAPARSIADLAWPDIDPEAPSAWDRDGDGLPDFMDPHPDDDSLPGRLTQPQTIRFTSGTTLQPVSIVNNRWDTFAWNASILTSANSPLLPEQFQWEKQDDEGNWAFLPPGDMPDGILSPGEAVALRLHFMPADLPGNLYVARMALHTDVFGVELTDIEAQP